MSFNSAAFQAAALAPADPAPEGIPIKAVAVMQRVMTSEFQERWLRPEGQRVRRVLVEVPVEVVVVEIREVDGMMD